MAIQKSDYYTQTQRKEELYSDFLTDLNPHPDAKDIVRFTNENAVKRSIRNLLQTNRYERLFQPNLGADINRILFEPMLPSTAQSLADFVKEAINNYEPRCKLIDVVVTPNERTQSYVVTVHFMVINKQDPVRVEITLYRVR